VAVAGCFAGRIFSNTRSNPSDDSSHPSSLPFSMKRRERSASVMVFFLAGMSHYTTDQLRAGVTRAPQPKPLPDRGAPPRFPTLCLPASRTGHPRVFYSATIERCVY
jgi:hypothetical protein